jgi:enoyl-CoA hydratase/carnithine racemase
VTIASETEAVLYEKRDGKAYITLNRPRALNAFNIAMRDVLFEVLGAVRDDPDVRVAILRGAGERAFCAGADLTEFLTAPSPTLARQARYDRDVWGLFLSIEKPIIAALHGYVLGSGVEMALCCDIRLAAADAQLGLPETGLGIIPAAGGSQTLPRAAGLGRGLEILLTGKRLTAQDALQAGLVDRLVPPAELAGAAEEMVHRIASLPPAAVAAAKRAVTGGLDLSLEQGLELEARLALQLSRGMKKEAQ